MFLLLKQLPIRIPDWMKRWSPAMLIEAVIAKPGQRMEPGASCFGRHGSSWTG